MSRGFRIALVVLLVPLGLLVAAGLLMERSRQPDARLAASLPYQPRYAAFRERLRALSGKLPTGVAEQRPVPPLDPPINYSTFPDAVDSRNTDGVMYEQMLDPDVEEVQPFGVHLSTFLIGALRWTGSHPPQTYYAATVPEGFTTELERGLNLRYLAVARVARFDPVVMVDAKTFRGGFAHIDGLLVDLQTDAVRCAFGAEARTPDRFEVYGKQKSEQNVSLQERARQALCQSARGAFLQKMLDVCGGHVRSDALSEFDRPCGW